MSESCHNHAQRVLREGAYKRAFKVSNEERLRGALQTLLDQVDYTAGACTATEMVGAVLPREVIELCHNVLQETK